MLDVRYSPLIRVRSPGGWNMTMMAQEPLPRRVRRAGVYTLIAVLIAGIAALAVGAVVYLMHPQWSETPATADAPPLPIAVAGVVFNVPPGAIRVPMQRRAGPQERIDLIYRWPELTPPDSHAAATPMRLFVTIEASQTTLPPSERLKSIYPRYIDAPSTTDPGGLTVAPFADGTPYQGEDVLYDASAPERFLVRCSRARGDLTLAMCLYERPIGAAALTFRFPRDWLADWRAVEAGIDRLVERWQPVGH
jgi:hypothetical protein